LSSFIDTFKFAVDGKGRFSIPASLREDLSDLAENTFVVSKGPDGCLDAYPLDEWRRRLRALRTIPNKKLERYYKRVVIGGAKRCKMDSHFRILVPPKLLRSVGIEKSVLIVGQLDHLEFWNPGTYRAYVDSHQIPLEDVLEEIETRLQGNPNRPSNGDW
jgi:MraZ protein